MGCCQVVWSALSVFSGTFVPVCPFGAKLCVLGHCLLCKIVTPSCFCCSQLRAGLRLFGFLISVRVLFHHAAVWCVGVPVDSLSLLIFVCIRFFSPFLQGFCVRRHVVRSVSALVRCSSCAIAVLPLIASACLVTLQTVFAAVHGAYCPTVALFLHSHCPSVRVAITKTCSKKKKATFSLIRPGLRRSPVPFQSQCDSRTLTLSSTDTGTS